MAGGHGKSTARIHNEQVKLTATLGNNLALHEELRPHGIKVSALCPGATHSEFAAQADMDRSELFKRFAGDAAAVARDGLERNRAVNVSGAFNATMVASTRFSPRAVNRRLAGWLQS